MPTFFYSRLSGSYDSIFKFDYNYPIISKWTKRAPLNLGAFAYNTILIPINKSQSHWCMAVVHVMEKRIEFYDSMGGQGTSANIMKLVKKWMEDEWEQKVMKSYTIGRMGTSTNRLDTLLSVAYANENWECNHINSCPQQADGFSCGMFVCMIAKRLTLGKSREGLLLASSSSNKSNTRRNFALDFHQSDVYEFRRAVSLQLQLLTVKNED